MDSITFKIVTPEGIKYEDVIEKVTIPTKAGAITVYPEHAPLVSILRAGELNIHKDGNVTNLAIAGGFFEIRPNSQVYVMADTAERAEEIDLERAQQARERAEELMKQQHDMEDVDFARIQAMIDREMARISVGNKYKNV